MRIELDSGVTLTSKHVGMAQVEHIVVSWSLGACDAIKELSAGAARELRDALNYMLVRIDEEDGDV